MSECHQALELVQGAGAKSALAAIIDLFLMGGSGSFLHCIGMCGPIASAQMSMRLLHLGSMQMQEKYKIKAAAAVPYYMGKALTYALLTLFAAIFTQHLEFLPYARRLGALLLVIVALSFAFSALREMPTALPMLRHFNIIHIPWQKWVVCLVSKLKMSSPFGWRGLMQGMVLGLIPCGLLYSAIVAAIAIAPTPIYAAIAMFAFGMGTIPGLFLISYLGQGIMASSKVVFRVLYISVLAVNVVFLLSYAMELMGH
ncbi:MAG: sulfite exporter TauE/SafE family protein [Proteobacteria bacterium]|nr:sulfite exporter TauE/SafE family protein [Pseudomonadota bacterium]